MLDGVGDGFFGDDVLSGGDGPGDLFRTRIRQGAQGDDLDGGIVKDFPLIGYDLRTRDKPAGCSPCLGGEITDAGDLPAVAFQQFVEVETSHAAESDQPDLDGIHFVGSKRLFRFAWGSASDVGRTTRFRSFTKLIRFGTVPEFWDGKCRLYKFTIIYKSINCTYIFTVKCRLSGNGQASFSRLFPISEIFFSNSSFDTEARLRMRVR